MINELDHKKLENIFHNLDALCEATDVKPSDARFLETIKSEKDVLIVQGTTDGLMWLARQALYVAKSSLEGKYMNFDEHSNLDKCDQEFIIQLKNE